MRFRGGEYARLELCVLLHLVNGCVLHADELEESRAIGFRMAINVYIHTQRGGTCAIASQCIRSPNNRCMPQP